MIVCDTHVLLFDAFAPRHLSKPARRALDRGEANGELACADISLWEMACLFASGRMRIDGDQQDAIRYVVAARAIRVLPITPDIAVRTTGLLADSDPADRLIAATALVHRATLVSPTKRCRHCPVCRWSGECAVASMTRRSGGHRLPSQVAATPARPLGMTTATFLRDYWQQRPLLIRGAFADFVNPVAPDDLAGLACEDLALARIAIHEPKRDRWTLRTGRSRKPISPRCRRRTGPCSCRTSTSGTPTSPPCSGHSPSCRAGASTMSW